MKIIIITTEPIPLPGLPATGAGLRAWGLVRGLRASGFDVEVGMAADALSGVSASARKRAEGSIFEREHLTEFVREHGPDVLIMQHWGLMNRLGEVDCPLAIDLAGPHLLERLFWGSANPQGDLEEKLAALSRADFLTCSGGRQRDYFIGHAVAAGFDPGDSALLPVIPFSLERESSGDEERCWDRFVSGGFFLPWQDPSRGVESLLGVLEGAGRGEFLCIGGAHPAGDVSQGRFDGLVERLRGASCASLVSPLPYDDFVARVKTCGVALDVMARNAERELAFPSRTVVYLACGLPVIMGDYGDLAALVKRYEAGWCVDPDDSGAIRRAIEEALRQPQEAARRGENGLRLLAEELSPERTVKPLAEWCANPQRRLRTESSGTSRDSLLKLRGELARLNEEKRELEGRRLVRLSNFLRRIGLRR